MVRKGRDSSRLPSRCRSGSLALVLALAGSAAGATEIQVDAVEHAAGGGQHRLSVAGRTDLPDGAYVQGYLKFGHDPESRLDRQAAPVAGGRFAFEFGPYASPFFPARYEVSVHFSPAEQPPAVLSGIDPPPGAAESARTVAIGDPGGSGPILAEAVAEFERVLDLVATLHAEGRARACASADREALARWLAEFRDRSQAARDAHARLRARWAHSPFPRVDREVFILYNYLIDVRYALESTLEDDPPDPPRVDPGAFVRRVSAARRQLAFESVLVHPDPAAAIERAWTAPLASRLATWTRGPAPRADPLPPAERAAAALHLAELAGISERRPAADPQLVNRWWFGLAETVDRLEEDAPPEVRAALAPVARAVLAGASLEAAVAAAVRELSLSNWPGETFAAQIEGARALAGDLYARTALSTWGDEFDPDGWEAWASAWDSEALRLQEGLHRPVPAILAPLLETPAGLPARRTRLSLLLARLLAEKERLAAEIGSGGKPPGLADREAAFRRELDEIARGG